MSGEVCAAGAPAEGVTTEVLVVGGGPAGLTTALSLAQRGIDVMLIERRDFTEHYPRAHLLNVRTMEVFADIGVADDIYTLAPPDAHWHRVAWYTSLAGPTPLHGLKIGDIPAWGGGPDAAKYELASPRKFANLPQIRLDRLLWEHADRQLSGRVLGHQELIDLDSRADGVTATIHDRIEDRVYDVRARYVVAADGGRTTGGLLGVQVHGPRALIDVVNVFVTADLSAYADPEALLTYFVTPTGRGSVPGTLLSLNPKEWAGESDQWSIGIKFPIGDPVADDAQACLQLIREQLGIEDVQMDVHAISHWQYEGVVAETFRVGSTFLAGDAAHRHPPTGGLGLNTAVQDAANLSWKLAAVLKGQAEEGLLDSYESERMPVAAYNVEHSLRNAGRHAPIGEAMGLRPGMPADQGWREVGIWAGDTAEGRRRQAAVERAVAANGEDYSQLNVEAGFCYEVGAVISDGTEPRRDQVSATEFVPSARPGHHVPHLWLRGPETAAGTQRTSTVDLVAPEGMTLMLSDEAAPQWLEAADRASAEVGCPVHVRVVARTQTETDGEFLRVCGLQEGGALLVRPDRHVAWRTASAPADPAAALGHALVTVLRGHGSVALPDGVARAPGITDAGEALRVGTGAAPRLFESEPNR